MKESEKIIPETMEDSKRPFPVPKGWEESNSRRGPASRADHGELGRDQYDDYEIDRLLGEFKKAMRPRMPTGVKNMGEERY